MPVHMDELKTMNPDLNYDIKVALNKAQPILHIRPCDQ